MSHHPLGAAAPLGSEAGAILAIETSCDDTAAAVVVAGQNFSDDPDVLVFIIVAALIGLVLLMPIGGELGKRSQAAGEE